jgi:ElaB/YqjD/DUF883 family membrane-anchored ribosome-binding protein
VNGPLNNAAMPVVAEQDVGRHCRYNRTAGRGPHSGTEDDEGRHRMSGAAKEKSDLDAIADDVAALKRDIAALMTHIPGNGSAGAVREATTRLGEEAKELYARLAAEGERTAQAIGRHVDEQPLTSVLVAFAAGFLAGRLLAR